jgi:hypothetical protein
MVETIGQRPLRSFLASPKKFGLTESDEPITVQSRNIRNDIGILVKDYSDLANKVAMVQYSNAEYIFLYRGQPKDYQHYGFSTIRSPIFRRIKKNIGTREYNILDLREKFHLLLHAESELIRRYPHEDGRQRLRRQRILRWAILQHYEVCETPLLDVTQSLRIAASFASLGTDGYAYLYVMGFPSLGGPVTAISEASLQLVRLSTACPPEARRAHLQEGYLLSEYPEIGDAEQALEFKPTQLDFGKRVIAKFRFEPASFWKRNSAFPQVPCAALFPDQDDEFVRIMNTIRSEVRPGYVYSHPCEKYPG